MTIADLLRKLIDWFLRKSPPTLETFEEEVIEGEGVRLIRYRRKTVRAYRTWRAVYKEREYDIVFGWDTLAFLPDVPRVKKQNRLSTHLLNIYRQGLHARYNPMRRCHEPDITVILKDQEVCMEADYMTLVVQRWKAKTQKRERKIQTTEDLVELMIDEVAMYAVRHPPAEIDPMQIDWRSVVKQTVRLILDNKNHQVFPKKPTGMDLGTNWVD